MADFCSSTRLQEKAGESATNPLVSRKRHYVAEGSVEDVETKSRKINGLQGMREMSNFQLVKVLSDDARTKTIVLHLRDTVDNIENEKDAVAILEKTPFSDSSVNGILSNKATMDLQFNNDIYSQYICNFPRELNIVKNTFIYPANEKHFRKYSSQKSFIVAETPDVYQRVTVPFINEQEVHLKWVYNILSKQAEADRIVFEDPDPDSGFILLPDLKWDGQQLENLYVMAVCHKTGIRTLRDINEKHLPLLKNMLERGTKAIETKYGIGALDLRVFVHYHPSYYHFHVHFTHTRFEAPGSLAGKAHLLQDVIDNIENIENKYYQKKTMFTQLKEQDKLFLLFKEAGVIS